MKSLSDLSSEKIISSLPQDCIDKLFASYIEDKEYDLSTFVETTTPPTDCYFIILGYQQGIFILRDITKHVPSGCYCATARRCITAGFDTLLIKIYCIPERKINEILYCHEELTRISKVYVITQPRLDILPSRFQYNRCIWNRLDILNATNEDMSRWDKRDSDIDYNITYYVPSKNDILSSVIGKHV